MQKKEKNKSPALNGHVHAEDIAHKAAAQYFGKEILSWLNIPGKVLAIAPTEFVELDIRHLYEDYNFVMDNGMWYHFEFESDEVTRADLKRFREYEATTSKVHNVDVVTYIICSAAEQKLLDELHTGINTYKVKVIGLKDYQAENIFAALQEKVDAQVASNDLIPVALCPLLNGSSSLKTRVVEGFHLLNRTYPSVEPEKQQCLQAILYLLASKFLTKTDLEEVKEVINVTYLGQLIYNDGYEAGVEIGIEKGIEKGIEQGKNHGIELGKEFCIVTMIRTDLNEGLSKEAINTKLKKAFHLNDEKLDSYWKKVM